MKVLIVGASGMIGGEALLQCLANPQISSVVAFVRRELPSNVSNNPKLNSVIVKDFSKWPEDLLLAHADAVGMIWYVISRQDIFHSGIGISTNTLQGHGIV